MNTDTSQKATKGTKQKLEERKQDRDAMLGELMILEYVAGQRAREAVALARSLQSLKDRLQEVMTKLKQTKQGKAI